MNKCIMIGVMVALATISGAFAVVSSTTVEIRNSPAIVHSQRFDRCPYYPSPIVCRLEATAAAPSGK